jgi:hypothetical protein
MDSKVYKSKTFWAGLGGILAGIGGFFTETMGAEAAIQTVIGSLCAIFLRDGIEKKAEK